MTFSAITLTLFPEMFPGPLGMSLAGKALEKGLWALEAVDIRRFAHDKHATVDDRPFGGGTGMVLKPDVVDEAIEHAKTRLGLLHGSNLIPPPAGGQRGVMVPDGNHLNMLHHHPHLASPASGGGIRGQSQTLRPPPRLPNAKIIYTSPRGIPITQSLVSQLKELDLIILCGRFEGVDQRVLDHHDMLEVSLGDFVLSGGEIAAMALLDACVRLLPGVIGKESALAQESFTCMSEYAGLLEYPHYTRPSIWKDRPVPDVLLSGNHEQIEKWRLEQAKAITKARRPDLMKKE